MLLPDERTAGIDSPLQGLAMILPKELEHEASNLARELLSRRQWDTAFIDTIREAVSVGYRAGKRETDVSTANLVIDSCVAIENLLYPDLADKRNDPKAVNQRLLEWIDAHVKG